MNNWEKVGNIGVDAGLCWIGDPCYCVTPDCSSHPADTWSEFCDKLQEDKGADESGVKCWDDGTGVSVSTGYGDGEYPVYVKRDSDGTIIEAKVVFVGDEEESCEHCGDEIVDGQEHMICCECGVCSEELNGRDHCPDCATENNEKW